jgi:hypothetical protein
MKNTPILFDRENGYRLPCKQKVGYPPHQGLDEINKEPEKWRLANYTGNLFMFHQGWV